MQIKIFRLLIFSQNNFLYLSLSHLTAYAPNSMEQTSSWKASSHLASQITHLYGTRRFITVFTTARNWSLSTVRWIQSKLSHILLVRFILILSFHLRLVIPSGPFNSGFPNKNIVRISSHHAHPPSYPTWPGAYFPRNWPLNSIYCRG